MPDLSLAMEGIYREMLHRDNELRFHPALKRRWAPALCRILELKWLHEQKMKQESNAKVNSSKSELDAID